MVQKSIENWSVWSKMALGELGTSMMMPPPCLRERDEFQVSQCFVILFLNICVLNQNKRMQQI